MQKQQLKHKLSLIVCIVLIAAMALFTYGCGDDNQPDADATDISTEQTTIQSGDIGKGEGISQMHLTATGSYRIFTCFPDNDLMIISQIFTLCKKTRKIVGNKDKFFKKSCCR